MILGTIRTYHHVYLVASNRFVCLKCMWDAGIAGIGGGKNSPATASFILKFRPNQPPHGGFDVANSFLATRTSDLHVLVAVYGLERRLRRLGWRRRQNCRLVTQVSEMVKSKPWIFQISPSPKFRNLQFIPWSFKTFKTDLF